MFRLASRFPLRAAAPRYISTSASRCATGPAHPPPPPPPPPPRASRKKSSFKGTILRWALAGGVVYYYNTSPLFQEEVKAPLYHTSAFHAPPPPSPLAHTPSVPVESTRIEKPAADDHVATEKTAQSPAGEGEASAAELPASAVAEEEEPKANDDPEGAFNPETGEINWDCPCLGGMAHGPCGEEFKAAFSCFIYSTEEPKGMDCIEKFKGMQDCFRLHPEIYGAELEEDEQPQPQPETTTNATDKTDKPVEEKTV